MLGIVSIVFKPEFSAIHTGNISVYPLYSTIHQNTPSMPRGLAGSLLRSSTFALVSDGIVWTTKFTELNEELSGSIHLALVEPVSPLHWSPDDAVI